MDPRLPMSGNLACHALVTALLFPLSRALFLAADLAVTGARPRAYPLIRSQNHSFAAWGTRTFSRTS